MIRSILAALVLVLLPACASADDVDPQPIRIMITGDSIAQGKSIAESGGYSWRYFLDQRLTGDVDLVGNLRGPDVPDLEGVDETYYADPNFDFDHAAVAGSEVCRPGILAGQMPIADLVSTYQPGIVVNEAGINDLRRGKTVDQLLDCYDTWLSQARAAKPDIKIVIARHPWSFADPDGATFNDRLQNWAGARTTVQSQIVLSQMAEPYDVTDTYDGLHPNQGGEEKIAGMIASSLLKLGVPVVAEPLLVGNAFAAVPPSASVIYSITRASGYTTVRWAARARVEYYVLRCGGIDRKYDDQVTTARFAESRSPITCAVRATNYSGNTWSVALTARRTR